MSAVLKNGPVVCACSSVSDTIHRPKSHTRSQSRVLAQTSRRWTRKKDTELCRYCPDAAPRFPRVTENTRHNSEVGIMNHFMRERVQNFERPIQLRADENLISAIIAGGPVPALADSVLAAAYALRPTAGDPPLGLFKRWEE